MANLNFYEYFKETENVYYDAKCIITILEKMLGKNFDEIKANVNNAKVLLSDEKIRAYLEQKLVEEDPELKQRVEKRELEHEKMLEEKRNMSEQDKEKELLLHDFRMTKEDIKEYSKAFADNIAIKRYQFEPFTLNYFNKYIGIVRSKLLTLLNIIERIGNRDIDSIQDLITDLDIDLDNYGNISKEDIVRLLTPTIYNFLDLNKKVELANQLSTYLTFKMSKHSLMKDGLSEDEIYPKKSLQIKDGFNGNEYVQLSSRQEKEWREKQKRNLQTTAKLILHL